MKGITSQFRQVSASFVEIVNQNRVTIYLSKSVKDIAEVVKSCAQNIFNRLANFVYPFVARVQKYIWNDEKKNAVYTAYKKQHSSFDRAVMSKLLKTIPMSVRCDFVLFIFQKEPNLSWQNAGRLTHVDTKLLPKADLNDFYQKLGKIRPEFMRWFPKV